jgi:alkylated DNA repair dioxygenase AlkB
VCRKTGEVFFIVDIRQHPMAEPPFGFSLAHNVVPDEMWEKIERWLQTGRIQLEHGQEKSFPVPWQDEGYVMQNRRIAQFGFRYDYHTDVVDTSTETAPMPSFLRQLLLDDFALSSLENADDFTQCIINDYTTADTVIPWHKDDPDFGPLVLVYTFGDDRPLNFRSLEEDTYKYYTARPRHGSRYILSGPARNDWEHSVPEGKGRRISITFRM